MTDLEWSTSTSPQFLLEFLRLRASDRKLRLFGCACCRLFLDKLAGTWAREAIETSELYADDAIPEPEMGMIRKAIHRAIQPLRGAEARLGWAIVQLLKPGFSYQCAIRVTQLAWTGRMGQTLSRLQCDLIRDQFGNSVQRPRGEASLNHGLVTQICQKIYKDRRFDLFPALREALASAGCQEQTLLDHCCPSLIHDRGCWLLDLILGNDF